MRGDPGGPRKISIQDLTIEYQDPKLGKVQSQISTRATAFSIGENIKIKFIAGDIGTVKLFENKFDSLMHYGGSWVLFIVSVFFLEYSLRIKGLI